MVNTGEREENLCTRTEVESEWLRDAGSGERKEISVHELKVKANAFGSPTVVVEKVQVRCQDADGELPSDRVR